MGIAIRLDVLAKTGGGDILSSFWTMVLSSLPLLVLTPLSPARYEFLLRILSSMTLHWCYSRCAAAT